MTSAVHLRVPCGNGCGSGRHGSDASDASAEASGHGSDGSDASAEASGYGDNCLVNWRFRRRRILKSITPGSGTGWLQFM